MKDSLKRVTSLSRKEFIHIVKDPRTLMIVFVMPLLQLVMFGYAFQMELREIRMSVVDHDGSMESRRLMESFAGGGLFKMFPWEDADGGPDEIFKARKSRAILMIPRDFQKKIERGLGADLQIIFDASDPNAAIMMKNYSSQVLGDYNASVGRAMPAPFGMRTSILYNPNLSSSSFFVPGIVAMLMIMICALLTSITIAREIESGTMEQILVSPIRPVEIITGKVIPYILLTFLDGSIILLVGIFLFGVPFRGSAPLMIGLSTLYLITALSLGLMISTLARTQQVAIMMALVTTVLPTILLSGLIFPIESMPLPLRVISYIVPAKYFLLIIRGIILKGSSIGELWQPVMFLGIMSAGLLAVAAKRFGMRLER